MVPHRPTVQNRRMEEVVPQQTPQARRTPPVPLYGMFAHAERDQRDEKIEALTVAFDRALAELQLERDATDAEAA